MNGDVVLRVVLLLATAVLPLAGVSCAGPPRRDNPPRAYVVEAEDSLLARHAPVFVLQTASERHNRIGTPSARLRANGKEQVYVDPAQPTYYGQREGFRTERGEYTNLIYRIHFECVPLPHLTAGRNVGLLAVVTLNTDGEPVLLTTVHSCGCYPAWQPTTYLPADARPEGWRTGNQEVFGEVLPGLLQYPPVFSAGYRPAIYLRDDVHRVMDVEVVDVEEAGWRFDVQEADLRPMSALDELPLDGGSTSFFHMEGRRRGYVKGCSKPLERLLISWWALDWRVGVDKRYGPRDEMNTVFYTSLKPWRREESDMWPFGEFLKYWGWRL
jgi:hypothetical protein